MSGLTMFEGLARRLTAVPGVVSAYVFGSAGTEREHRESDIDVGVLLDRRVLPQAAERAMRTLIAVACVVGGFGAGLASGRQSPVPDNTAEEIRIVRSVRLSRAPASAFCAQSRTTIPDAESEDRYNFVAVATRAADGAVTNALGPPAGTLHACYGHTAAATGERLFYAEGDLGGVTFTGMGTCTTRKTDVPEARLSVSSCFLNLTSLPAPYAGGLLTTNSLRSRRPIGPDSDPAGYVQPSIATVRLWKRR